jgi:hypothetical protein
MRALAAGSLFVAFAFAFAFAACRTHPVAPGGTLVCPPSVPPIALEHGLLLTGYHGGAPRLGWNDAESTLTAAAATKLTLSWCSPPLDDAIVDGTSFSPHLYATPLFVDDVAISAPGFAGLVTSVALAATSNGDVYAIAAADAPRADGTVVTAGTLLWRAHLTDPVQSKQNSDGVPVGVLGTPMIDPKATPPRVYVTSADATRGWLAFALDLGAGTPLAGWPVTIDAPTVEALNSNADPAKPATFEDVRKVSQRGALNLSSDGAYLYIGFGSYYDDAVGFMVVVDTRAAKIAASLSGAPSDADLNLDNRASAGIWGAGGPAIDAEGRILVTTGNSPPTSAAARGVWGNSLLVWKAPLSLVATYSPFNYCSLDVGDVDVGGSSPIVFDLDPTTTSTPRLAAFGSKQGVTYLVNRDTLTGRLDARPACTTTQLARADTDGSLYGPDLRTYYSPPSRGPLSVFGPYSDAPGANEVNKGKMRTSPAYFRDASGQSFLFVSGNSRDASDSSVVAPSLARLRVVTTPGAPAYLALDATAPDVVFKNPGPPIVTSSASHDALVWVLDENASRTDPLVSSGKSPAPHPIVYAFDAQSLALLWKQQLPAPGGKYNHVTVAHGNVIVGADRLYVFRAP